MSSPLRSGTHDLIDPRTDSSNVYDDDKTSDVECKTIVDQRFQSFKKDEQKRIIRTVDRRLILTLGLIYAAFLMDRTNTGVAVIAGMGVDLVLIGSRYNIIVLVFFISSVLLQPLAVFVIRRIGPRTFLPTIALLWGATLIGMGFVERWTHLVALRLVLGAFEAGYFPGCVYLLSCWYPRFDLQKRYAVFYLIGSLLSAFSGILSYGFSRMAGLGSGTGLGQHYGPTKQHPKAPSGEMSGIAGWRWIFIMEGLITCLLGLVGYVFIVDFPEQCGKTRGGVHFLDNDEAAFMVARIEQDRHDATLQDFNLVQFAQGALDLNVWSYASLFGLTTTSAYAVAYFIPLILANMGFSVPQALCLITPPYVLAAVVMFVFAWYSDKWRIRSPFIIFNGLFSILGLALLGFPKNVGLRYFGIFLTVVTCNANVPAILTWQANNIRGQWKRAMCSATLVIAGGIGGIIGGTVFRSQDAPGYRPGIITTMLAGSLVVLISLIMVFRFDRANKRAEATGSAIEGLQGFRYTL